MGQGFTLTELVVVIVILAIWAVIAVPRFANSLSNQRVENAARRITKDLALARQQARIASASRTITFDGNSHSYVLSDTAGLDHSSEPYRVVLAGEPYYTKVVSADFGGDDELVFDGYGVPDSGGSVVIESAGYRKTLSFSADTCEVTVQ